VKIYNRLSLASLIRVRYLVAGFVVMLVTFPAHANVLLPGDTNVPDVFANPSGSPPLLDTTSGTFSFGSGMGLLTGSYFEAVLVDPLGVTCAGCLDFAFQISEDSGLSSGIFSTNLSAFFGYTTDVGYVDGTGAMGGSGGDGNPVSVSRGPFGGGVGFNFATATAGAPIGPGGSSAILVVATNATTFDSLGVLAINGGRQGSPANGQISGVFEPTFQAVPEASTALLLTLGLAGFAAFRKRTS
jgi:hypothetical protein